MNIEVFWLHHIVKNHSLPKSFLLYAILYEKGNLFANILRSMRECSFTYKLLELRCLAAMLGWCHHRLHLVVDRGRVSREGVCFKSNVISKVQFFFRRWRFLDFFCCLRTIVRNGMLLYASLSSLEKKPKQKSEKYRLRINHYFRLHELHLGLSEPGPQIFTEQLTLLS